MFIVGSQNSSNSNRLKEVAERKGVTAFLIDNASQIEEKWLHNVTHIGLSAGASAPEYLVEEVKQRLSKLGVTSIHDDLINQEDTFFPLPKELQVNKES